MKDIVEVEALEGHCLRLRFEDQVEAVIDIAQLISFSGVFAPLADPGYFAQVRADPELGTVVWPNGADIDPDVLYALATGQPLHTSENSSSVTVSS